MYKSRKLIEKSKDKNKGCKKTHKYNTTNPKKTKKNYQVDS